MQIYEIFLERFTVGLLQNPENATELFGDVGVFARTGFKTYIIFAISFQI